MIFGIICNICNTFLCNKERIYAMKLRKIAILLALLMLASSLASCSGTETTETADTTASENTAAATETEPETEPDPFAEMDFGGQDIRMLVSNQDKNGRIFSTFAVISNEEGLTGEVVSDAVYNRNTAVEELLNISFSYTETPENCLQFPSTVTNLLTAGDDAYELIVNDMYPLATLSVSNSFINIMDLPYLDFSQEYWYEEYMNDVSFSSNEKRYILAGDYFLDVLRSAHALYFNKDRFTDLYGDPNVLYEQVLNNEWTQDLFMEYKEGAYQDLNGNGQKDGEDLYGYSTNGYWGPMIPWVIGSDITFLQYREDGSPYFAMNNERSVNLMSRLIDIFYGEGTYDFQGDYNTAFVGGQSLFGGYMRVGNSESFRDMEYDIGILPIPKMDDEQENYITSSHDTTIIGVIPITCTRSETIAAVLEVLSRETNKTVIPAYYEIALKTKYVRDSQSAQIMDIIRQNISCVFPVAFGNYCNDLPLKNTFSALLTSKSTDFVSTYTKLEGAAQKKLDELWQAFSAND